MDLSELKRSIVAILERSDFSISTINGPPNMSFDLVARRDDTLLVVKAITSRGSFKNRLAGELKVLSRVLSASPLILHPTYSTSVYRDGVLYILYGIPLMTLNTLHEFLVEEVPPMVYYGSGGHYVTVDGPKIRAIRESAGISIGSLSKTIGVSRRAVQMYENGMGIDMEMALKLEETLGVELILPLDPFSRGEELEMIREEISKGRGPNRDILEHLDSIGMEVIPTSKCPFDALARSGNDLLMTSIGDERIKMEGIGSTLSRISKVTGNESFMVATRPIRGRNIGGTPVLSVEDLKGVENTDDLIDMIRNRRK